VGLQCFKFAGLSFFPFGKEVVYGGGAASLLLNIIWLLVSGLPLAIESAIIGVLLCITIVGIPFGLQQFKLAKLALMPFGSRLYIRQSAQLFSLFDLLCFRFDLVNYITHSFAMERRLGSASRKTIVMH
jgi:uncharacterized membrane protein YccF (DUF307 family)